VIPSQDIIAWSQHAPWAELRQVEQDLIISRALVELFNDPFLRDQLRFRGGTALNKLHFPTPMRYSEDIDLVRTAAGASKPILDRIHDALDPWLGAPAYFRSSVAPSLEYRVEAEDRSGRIRLKVEINETELTAFDQPQTLPFAVDNPWFSGSTTIPTFSTEEILATKLRALLQRNKGRDLVDLSHALATTPALSAQRVVDILMEYLKASGTDIPRWTAESRMFDKLSKASFLADVRPLLSADEQGKFDDGAGRQAFISVFRDLVTRMPGKPWATTKELLTANGFDIENSFTNPTDAQAR
jgi:predicted nucleotidyltransferase component of viral defense system